MVQKDAEMVIRPLNLDGKWAGGRAGAIQTIEMRCRTREHVRSSGNERVWMG